MPGDASDRPAATDVNLPGRGLYRDNHYHRDVVDRIADYLGHDPASEEGPLSEYRWLWLGSDPCGEWIPSFEAEVAEAFAAFAGWDALAPSARRANLATLHDLLSEPQWATLKTIARRMLEIDADEQSKLCAI